MSIPRPPATADRATPRRVAVERSGDGMIGVAAPPPEDLLPSGGSDHGVAPASGLDAAFLREVDEVRRQLEPLRTRGSLAASFGREAGHWTTDGPAPATIRGSITPLRFAYALRWLELGRVAAPPEWADLLDGPVE